mgnify:FL=1
MKRMNCYFLLLAASLCVLPLHAQKEYPIDRITAINLGDGRILHREISDDKPLTESTALSTATIPPISLPVSRAVFSMAIMKSTSTTS